MQPVITGLNLLRLLVDNRLAEFHAELELLDNAQREHEQIAFPIHLEQCMAEGSWHKVLKARNSAPHELCTLFLEQLEDTVREEISKCCESAYKSLKISDAVKLMMFESEEELMEYVGDREEDGWSAREGRLYFKADGPTTVEDIPALKLIGENLQYANELERIV